MEIIFIEYNGDPLDDEKLKSRYVSGNKFEPIGLNSEVKSFVSSKEFLKALDKSQAAILSFQGNSSGIYDPLRELWNYNASLIRELKKG